jgi:hypothetical protein
MGRWIEARRDGRCQHCGKAFAPGDQIWAKSAGVYYGAECGCGLLDENSAVSAGEIEASVLADLARLPLEAGDTALAKSMLYLARQLDARDVAPREVTNYTKEIRLAFLSLKDEYPVGEENDETDEARQRRVRRREAGGF